MEAGKLNHRITIQQPATATDALGQVIEGSLADVATVWAAKWQLSTKDVSRQAGQTEQAEAKFLIRYRDNITTLMSVTFNGKRYQITGTEEFEDRVGLFLFVRSFDA
jgi:SPP1 family predicted phage head-tail adaptor